MAYETDKLVNEYLSSGLTQKRFCTAHHVAASTLSYHLQKKRKSGRFSTTSKKSDFIPVKIDSISDHLTTIVVAQGKFSTEQVSSLLQSVCG